MKRMLSLFVTLVMLLAPMAVAAENAQAFIAYVADPVITVEGETPTTIDLTGLHLQAEADLVDIATRKGEMRLDVYNGDAVALSGFATCAGDAIVASLSGMTSAVTVKLSDVIEMIKQAMQAEAAGDVQATTDVLSNIDIEAMAGELVAMAMSVPTEDAGTAEVEFYDGNTYTANVTKMPMSQEQIAAFRDIVLKYLDGAIEIDMDEMKEASVDVVIYTAEEGVFTRVDVTVHPEGEEVQPPVVVHVYVPDDETFHLRVDMGEADDFAQVYVSVYPDETDGVKMYNAVVQLDVNNETVMQLTGYGYTQDESIIGGVIFSAGEIAMGLDLEAQHNVADDGMHGYDFKLSFNMTGETPVTASINGGFYMGEKADFALTDTSAYTLINAEDVGEEFMNELMMAAMGGLMSLTSIPGVAALMQDAM